MPNRGQRGVIAGSFQCIAELLSRHIQIKKEILEQRLHKIFPSGRKMLA